MPNGTGLGCMGLELKFEQSFMPFHFSAGCGAFQRSSPTGGAAKGIPLNAMIFLSSLQCPFILPVFVAARGAFWADAEPSSNAVQILATDSSCPTLNRKSMGYLFWASLSRV